MSNLKSKFNSLIILAALVATPTLVVNSNLAAAAITFHPPKGTKAISGASFIRACEADGGTISGYAPSGGNGGNLMCDKPGRENDTSCSTHTNGNLEVCATKPRPKKFDTAGGNGGGAGSVTGNTGNGGIN